MRRIVDKIFQKIYKLIPALAILLAAQSVTSTCCFWFYQPDIPEDIVK